MRGMRKRIITTSVALVLMIGVCWLSWKRTSPVPYHRDALRSWESSRAPSTFRDYFRLSSWRWLFHGRPSFSQILKHADEHRQALIRLGYFETREFTLIHRTMDPSGFREFSSLLTNAAFSDRQGMCSTIPGRPLSITVTARREDMAVWQSVVSRFDSKDTR